MNAPKKSIHGQWTSRWAYILATTGAAVGLGNIWKFPYIAGQNGGGAFVLIYLVCIAIIGLPLLMTESLIGRLGRQNPANSMKTMAVDSGINHRWSWVGGMYILSGFLILSYYSVIAGWALDYSFQAALGHFTNGSAQHIDSLFESLVSSPYKLIRWHSLIMGGTVAVVIFGVEHGLERSVRFMFPTMFVLLIAVVIYSASIGNFTEAMRFLFQPDFSEISSQGILIALGHAFFTLSLATGSIMMYGAYIPENVSITKSAAYIAAADTSIALIAGLAIFPIVFAYDLTPSAGPGLIFKTLPIAFGKMPYGALVGTIFFIMLLFAAFTSAISLIEPTVAWLIERLHMTRPKAALSAGFMVWLLGFGTIFSFNIWSEYKFLGKDFFNAIDYLTANLLLPIGGICIAVFAAWRMKQQHIFAQLHTNSSSLFYRTWHFSLGIVAPLGVSLVFLHVIGVV